MLEGKILLATDFSEAAAKLTETLLDLKNMGLNEVMLVHAVDISREGLNTDQLVKENKKKLMRIKQEIENSLGMKTIVKVPVGIPSDKIYELSERPDVSLILMASHGAGYLKQIFLGSTTHNVIRRVKKPVLIEKFQKKDGEYELVCKRKFNRIMLPIDFSEPARKVLELIKKMYIPAQEIILVSIIESSSSMEELQKSKKEARSELEKIKTDLEEHNINCCLSIRIGQGVASSNIINIAEEEEAGIIMMSTRGKGSIRELILGSTASRVVRYSPIPVLLIPVKNRITSMESSSFQADR